MSAGRFRFQVAKSALRGLIGSIGSRSIDAQNGVFCGCRCSTMKFFYKGLSAKATTAPDQAVDTVRGTSRYGIIRLYSHQRATMSVVSARRSGLPISSRLQIFFKAKPAPTVV